MNILVAFNSFKEVALSVELNQIALKELSVNSNIRVISRPLSDGGDGFLEVCELLFDIKPSKYENRKTYSNFLKKNHVLFDEKNNQIFIESAKLFGLNLFPKNLRNPSKLNTEILGKIIRELASLVHSSKLNLETVWIGVGGTATIDFGLGACSQLGLELLNNSGELINPIPEKFLSVRDVKFRKIEIPFKIKFIVDVNTELFGNPGAIEIYGKQKGASDIKLLEIKNGIMNVLRVIEHKLGILIPNKLNGAGGGVASGFSLFYDAEIISAKEFIRNYILKNLKLEKIDAVITGEGQFDDQSYQGKGAGVILEIFKDKKIPVFLINGSTSLTKGISLPDYVKTINLTDFFSSKEESIQKTDLGLKKAINIVLNKLSN